MSWGWGVFVGFLGNDPTKHTSERRPAAPPGERGQTGVQTIRTPTAANYDGGCPGVTASGELTWKRGAQARNDQGGPLAADGLTSGNLHVNFAQVREGHPLFHAQYLDADDLASASGQS